MNTGNITLSFAYIVTLGITSGFFAGLISTIGNILITFFNNKSEKGIETIKYHNSINDYRYKELHCYLKNVCDLPNKVYAVQEKKRSFKID